MPPAQQPHAARYPPGGCPPVGRSVELMMPLSEGRWAASCSDSRTTLSNTSSPPSLREGEGQEVQSTRAVRSQKEPRVLPAGTAVGKQWGSARVEAQWEPACCGQASTEWAAAKQPAAGRAATPSTQHAPRRRRCPRRCRAHRHRSDLGLQQPRQVSQPGAARALGLATRLVQHQRGRVAVVGAVAGHAAQEEL